MSKRAHLDEQSIVAVDSSVSRGRNESVLIVEYNTFGRGVFIASDETLPAPIRAYLKHTSGRVTIELVEERVEGPPGFDPFVRLHYLEHGRKNGDKNGGKEDGEEDGEEDDPISDLFDKMSQWKVDVAKCDFDQAPLNNNPRLCVTFHEL